MHLDRQDQAVRALADTFYSYAVRPKNPLPGSRGPRLLKLWHSLGLGYLLAGLAMAFPAPAERFIYPEDMRTPPLPAAPSTHQGEFGGDLQLLERFYFPPQDPRAGNHVIDLWENQMLPVYLANAGLTNNRALFVNSHGAAFQEGDAQRHYLYPHESSFDAGETPPRYSAADVARVLGRAAAAQIHIVVLTGCDENAALNLAEWRAVFPACTNIIHTPAGKLGFQPMLWQMLFTHSSEITPLYETPQLNDFGETEYRLGGRPENWAARRLEPFVADLYEPDKPWPSRRQIAGRELFLPQTTDRRASLSRSSSHGM